MATELSITPSEWAPLRITMLSSVSDNLARAVGPAVAGLVIALAGPAVVFLLNAIAFV